MSRNLATMTEEEWTRTAPAARDEGFGALETDQGRLPLKALGVHARIEGLLAQVNVTQTYVNTCPQAVEATYIFPLPDRAAVTNFRLEVNGRVIEGLLKERMQARTDYNQAIRAGHRAAITEEERPGVFTLRVGNLMPGEEATLTLTFTGPLVYSDGEATFRFPLVVAPRYIPGSPLPGPSVGSGTATDTDAVPDASRITPPVLLPGFPNPVRLALSVEVLPSAVLLGAAKSSLHAIEEEREGRLRWITIQPGERLNRDFILRFAVDPNSLHTALTLQPDSSTSRDGTFLLTLVPPAQAATQKPRDVVFVLDRSGSMGGWKMVTARRAVGRMVDTLLEQDRFTILAFDDSIETPPNAKEGLIAASDSQRCRAIEWLSNVEARGGTEMHEPLKRATDQLLTGQANRERIVVLLTDGQVGNEDQILRSLGKQLKQVRVFTLGIDQAVNAAFLQRLAEQGGGTSELVESEDRLDDVMEHVHRRIGQPVLSHLQLEPTGINLEGDSVVPERAPDLFPGVPVLLMGRYKGYAEGAITVHGVDDKGQVWNRRIAAQIQPTGALATVWARAQIRKLEDMYLIREGEKAQLERQIVETSVRYQVLSRFTAYVAVDRSAVVNPDGKPREITQPVEMPAGWAQPQMRLARCLSAPVQAPAGCGSYGAGAMPPAPAARAMSATDAADMHKKLEAALDGSGNDRLETLLSEVVASPNDTNTDFDEEAMPQPRKARSKAKKSRGLLGRIADAFSGGSAEEGEQAKEDAPALPELPEVATLVQDLTAKRGESAPARMAELRRISGPLADLSKKLRATHAEVAAKLDDWLRRFRALQSRPVLDAAELDRLWAELEQGLQGLTGTARAAFWK